MDTLYGHGHEYGHRTYTIIEPVTKAHVARQVFNQQHNTTKKRPDLSFFAADANRFYKTNLSAFMR
jgi:hypothetical protein